MRIRLLFLLFIAIWCSFGIPADATVVTWSQSSIPASSWSSVSISSDGSVQSILTSTSKIYQSFDIGSTWSNKTIIGDTSWSKIDISETGKYQTATTVYCLPWVSGCVSHYLYRSDDYGKTFVAVAYSAQWTTVSLSGSGQYQAASEYADYGGNIAISSDYGLTWKTITPSGGTYWCGVVISYTGQYLTAVTDSSTTFYISSNFGSSWTSITSSANLNVVAMSSSGMYQLGFQARGGYLYRSADYGNTWNVTSVSSPGTMCLSNDGKVQVATAAGSLYVSTDYGLTFSTQAFSGSWQLLDISSSGDYIVGAISSGNVFNIYIDAQPPTVVPTFFSGNSLTPTIQPTLSDIDISVFDSISGKSVREKTKYYLGSFVAYFLISYIILYLFKRSGYGKKTVDLLNESSFNSGFYTLYSQQTTDVYNGEVRIFHGIVHRNKEIARLLSQGIDGTVNRITITDDDDVNKESLKVNDAYKYDASYVRYAISRRYLLGCKPVLFPNGLKLNLCFTTISFTPGYVENLMLFLCNNHQFFNMIYFIDNTNNFGSRGRILVYIVKECVVFVMAQFLAALFQYYSVNGFEYMDPFVKIFIITPISIAVGIGIIYLYSVPCVESNESISSNKQLKLFIIFLSRFFIVPVVIIMAISLILACLFTTGRRVPFILLDFFITVQLFSIVMEIIYSMMGFCDNYTYNLTVFGRNIVSIGDYFAERIVGEKLTNGVDFVVIKREYLAGFVQTAVIFSRDEAVKRGLLADASKANSAVGNTVNVKRLSNDAFEATDNPIVHNSDFKYVKSNKTKSFYNTKVGGASEQPDSIYTDNKL